MSERYEFIDMTATGPKAVRTAFANQVAYCRANDARVTARVVAALGALLDKPASEFACRIAGWQGAPLADALPLRAAGGIHALHLSEAAHELAPIYADAEDINDEAVIAGVVRRHDAALLPWLDGPPQTNEAGRSSNFIAAMLWLTDRELPPRFDAPAMLDRLGSGSVAGTMMVPAMIRPIVDEAKRRGMDRVEGVRRICYGASPIDEPLLREALGLFGCDFIQGYGLTETAGVATTLSPADHVAALAGRPELLRSAGRPVMGAQVRIAGPTGERLPLGEIGEVQIRGPNLFLGFWRNPEKTAAAWTDDGWFRTGDAGRIDCDGYLYLVDRMQDLIISGGENVFPQEVERVLLDHEAVRECAAFGIADRKWGELVAAAVVLRDGCQFDEGALRAHAGQRLARFKCPSHYLQLSELPRNATGKILRRELVTRLRPDMAA